MESMKAMTQHGEDDELRRFGKCAGTGEVDHRIFCPYDPVNPLGVTPDPRVFATLLPPHPTGSGQACCGYTSGVTPNTGGRKRALPAIKLYESKKGWSQPKLHRWGGNRAN